MEFNSDVISSAVKHVGVDSGTLCAERLYLCVRGVDKARRAEKRPSITPHSLNPHTEKRKKNRDVLAI